MNGTSVAVISDGDSFISYHILLLIPVQAMNAENLLRLYVFLLVDMP